MAEIKLREWQATAIEKCLNWFGSENEKLFLINAAPGAGKTICASVIAKQLLDSNKINRIIVIAPRSEVVKQWGEEFEFVTGRHMSKVTAADGDIDDFGLDVCATWSAIDGLQDAFQLVCKNNDTLVICDEHHHAAVEATWGKSADSAFKDAKFGLILSGTPVRADGEEPIWFAYDKAGRIDHPERGTFSLSYGEAVDLNYCRPISFHRHEGKFNVKLEGGDFVSVSGEKGLNWGKLQKLDALQNSLDFYKLACTPKYIDENSKIPDLNSYQSTMLSWGIQKLEDVRNSMPNAGGLVIAPNIEVAEYMAALLEELDGEKPTLVHSKQSNPEARIASFKNTDKKWLVSVSMVSEGVDIKRLRVLVFLPIAQTELFFRQAMGRVVRTMGDFDYTRAYVVMPAHKVFEQYARRVEREMSPAQRKESSEKPTEKVCSVCEAKNPISAEKCGDCETEFEKPKTKMIPCPDCETLNTIFADACINCGRNLKHQFEIELRDALRMGAIVRGMDVDEDSVRGSEEIAGDLKKAVFESGDEMLLKFVQQIPEEAYIKFQDLFEGVAKGKQKRDKE